MLLEEEVELKIVGQRNRGMPVKRWIDVVEEDMREELCDSMQGIGRVGGGEQ